MSSISLTGVIAKIGVAETIAAKTSSSKDFVKREVWVKIPDEKFPQTLNLEFHAEKCELLKDFAEGQEVNIDVNLNGRTYTDKAGNEKCFNTLQAWRIEASSKAKVKVKVK